MVYRLGDGGWVLFSHLGDDTVALARVRFVLSEDGRRLEIAEVHVEGADHLSGEALRALPLPQMEALANGREREELITLISNTAPRVAKATDRWLTVVGGGHRGMVELGKEAVQNLRRAALRLGRIPDNPKKPDEFYRRVAEMYMALVASGSRRPAQEIADSNWTKDGLPLPVTTVHRWIREARDRQLLGSGRSGKAG